MNNLINELIEIAASRPIESIIFQRDNLSYLVPADQPEFLSRLLEFVLVNFDTSRQPSRIYFDNNDMFVCFES